MYGANFPLRCVNLSWNAPAGRSSVIAMTRRTDEGMRAAAVGAEAGGRLWGARRLAARAQGGADALQCPPQPQDPGRPGHLGAADLQGETADELFLILLRFPRRELCKLYMQSNNYLPSARLSRARPLAACLNPHRVGGTCQDSGGFTRNRLISW